MALGRLAAEPFGGLAYVWLNNDGFSETGGAAALAGAHNVDNLGYSTLGLRLATLYALPNGTTLAPRATAAWQHAFGSTMPTTTLAFQAGGTPFSIAAVPLARDSALVEGGFDLRLNPRAKLGVAYTGELAPSAQSHAVKGSFTWNF